MSNPIIAAYVAFAFMLVLTWIGLWFSYRLFSLRRYYSMQLFNWTMNIYYYPMVFICSFAYIAIGITFLIMTIIHGRIWANWCWRWAIVGSLLDVRLPTKPQMAKLT